MNLIRQAGYAAPVRLNAINQLFRMIGPPAKPSVVKPHAISMKKGNLFETPYYFRLGFMAWKKINLPIDRGEDKILYKNEVEKNAKNPLQTDINLNPF